MVKPPKNKRIVRTTANSEPIKHEIQSSGIATTRTERLYVKVNEMHYIDWKPTNCKHQTYYY
jgi:hypothetical protein